MSQSLIEESGVKVDCQQEYIFEVMVKYFDVKCLDETNDNLCVE